MRKLELSFLTCLALLVTGEPSLEELTLQVNTKKLVSVSSDKFLSLAIDPLVILTSNDVSVNYERSIRMARALSPAYLRLGGPQSNSYLLDDRNNVDYVFSENNWRRVNQWAEKTGLDVVACISPRLMRNDSQVDLVSLTDRMGFNASWQLGYECQTRCNFSGTEVGRYVKILRDKLNAIPRYSNSIITGPDVLDYQTKEQREYLEKFFTEAEESLTAVTWHPNFTNVVGNEDDVFVDNDRLILDKNDLYEILGHDVAKKPLWIAESKAETRKNQFVGALVWTNRLGNTAKLGIEVLMRQPVDLSKPTPDYWVSVLHKKLVGREVLNTRIQTDNRSHVHFYVQCTKASAIYPKGALTIFGINPTPMKIRANVKGFKIKNLHEYVLTPGFDTENRMYAKTVLLNGKPLNLFKEIELPVLEPVMYNNEKGLSIELSSGAIGFWVVPDQKIKSCMNHELEKENVIEKNMKKELQENQIERNEIPRKKRLIDYNKTIKCHRNKKSRRLMKRELDVKEWKSKKDELEKVFPRKLATGIESKRSTKRESIDLFEKQKEQVKEIQRSKKDLEEFASDFRNTDQKYDTRRSKRSWTMLNKKKARESNENNVYGFSKQEPMKNFPNGDVFLQIDDSTGKNMDYTKDKDEKKEKGWKTEDVKIPTIDHSKSENTWINLDDDYRGYTPNEFFETASITNTGMKENSNDYYTKIWQGENIQKHWVNQENDKEDNAKTKPVSNVASGVGEEKRTKGNTVNMLMNYYSDSSVGKSNQENLEESFRVKTQGSKLGDSSAAFLDKTKLTLPEKRKKVTIIPIEKDKMKDLGVLHYSKSIIMPMNIPVYIDSKQGKRSKRNLDMILEKEMINEDETNSKDCKYRVIRNFNDDLKFIPCKIKRNANENYKETMVSSNENVDNYETEHDEETAESVNENVDNYETEHHEEIAESVNENVDNYETEHYEETAESGNENVDNYKTEHYEETIESSNENVDNYETEHYEETIESSNENVDNYETEHYEETTESGNENIENYKTEQLEKDNKQSIEFIKSNSELDQMDNDKIDDSSTTIPELTNQLPKTLEDELSMIYDDDDESENKKQKFFRGLTGETENTEQETNYSKDNDIVISRDSQDVSSISEKKEKTKKIKINTDTSSPNETEETETEKSKNPITAISKRGRSSKRNKEQVRNVPSQRKKSANELTKSSPELLNGSNSTDSLETSKIKQNSKKPKATEEALLTSNSENLTVVKKENENRKRSTPKLKAERNQHNHRERREISEMIGSKLGVREEKIPERYENKILDTMKRENVNENKMKVNLKRQIWENNEDDDNVIDLKRNPNVLTYESIDEDILEKEKEKNQVRASKKIEEESIEPENYLHAKSDGSKSRLIQSIRFPYNILDERKRYDKDEVAFDKGYYALVYSTEEKNPWMFQYQRKSNEKLRNAYQSKGKEISSENLKIRTLKIPIGYIYDKSEETTKSEEKLKLRPSDYKIYSIDPELERHDYSSKSLNYDDDSITDFYNLIQKPKFDKIIFRRLKSNQDQRNAPIFYASDTKRQKNVQKQPEEYEIVNNFRNSKPDDSKTIEKDVTNEDYSNAVIPNSIENAEKIEGISKIIENQENVKNHRTRREADKNEHNYVNFNDDLMIDKFDKLKNSKLFSKLLKISNLVENPKKNSRLSFSSSFTTNSDAKSLEENLSKNTIPLSKDIDLIEKLDHILLDDNKLLNFKSEENESSNSEENEDETSETYLTEIDREILNNEINHENEHFYGNQGINKWTEVLPTINKQFMDSNSNNNEYSKKKLQRENEIFKNPKLNLKYVYNYIKENDDKLWEDINHENLNKKSETLEEFWEFNPLSIPKEKETDNFLEDFSRHDSVMKNNGQRDQPNDDNKSSFLQGTIPKLQEMITEGFDKAQNLAESLEEFTESIDKKFNGTLPKDDKNKIFRSATSSMSTENIFHTIITNVTKFFASLLGSTRIFYEKL